MAKVTVLIVGLLTAISASSLWHRYGRDVVPLPSTDDLTHFKYGSIGAEVNGYPFRVWRELPYIFPERVDSRWSTFGFLSEPGKALPVGLSVRRYGVERIGFNCATCHTSRVEGHPGIILGAPAVELDIQSYLRFLSETAASPAFSPNAIFDSAKKHDRAFDWIDQLVYRFLIIPKVQNELANYFEEDGAWMNTRAPHGPGRTDAGNPWRVRFEMHPERDGISGAVDMPSLWNQRIRQNAWLHWDGNNRSLNERNLSAALAGGASEESLDHPSIERVAVWSLDAKPPAYPFRIDSALAERGRAIYEEQACSSCHSPGGSDYGHITPNTEIGADADRLDLFSTEILNKFNDVGRGRSWQFRNYRKSNGYANSALDGIWARAPYMHNGSVPTLSDPLFPVESRPTKFLRGCSRFDSVRVGFRCEKGRLFDTNQRGNRNTGHLYGTGLQNDERRALVEFLKTL